MTASPPTRVALRLPAIHVDVRIMHKAREIERRIIQLLAHHAIVGKPEGKFVALGLAEARMILLAEPRREGPLYVSDMLARISSLSRRQQDKLRAPTCDRASQQKILENS